MLWRIHIQAFVKQIRRNHIKGQNQQPIHPFTRWYVLHLYFEFKYSTVEKARFAPLTLDSPLISIYYLPYENGKLKKFVFYSGHHISLNWS